MHTFVSCAVLNRSRLPAPAAPLALFSPPLHSHTPLVRAAIATAGRPELETQRLADRRLRDVSCGTSIACALTEEGEVYLWGYGVVHLPRLPTRVASVPLTMVRTSPRAPQAGPAHRARKLAGRWALPGGDTATAAGGMHCAGLRAVAPPAP
jgi:hypothetical protein